MDRLASLFLFLAEQFSKAQLRVLQFLCAFAIPAATPRSAVLVFSRKTSHR
jgi:hypothetical protein